MRDRKKETGRLEFFLQLSNLSFHLVFVCVWNQGESRIANCNKEEIWRTCMYIYKGSIQYCTEFHGTHVVAVFSAERRITEWFSIGDLRFLDFASVLISFETIKEGFI